jgi:S1-C subfamily serine protease
MVCMGRRAARSAAVLITVAAAAVFWLLAAAPPTLPLALDYLPLPEAARVDALTASTVRILAFGCGTRSEDGSGVVLHDGRILTNRHVVDGALAMNVVPDAGRTTNGAALVATAVDVGVVRPTLPVGSGGLRLAPHDPEPGDELLVAGHPFGGPLRVLAAHLVDVVDGASLGQAGPVLRLDARVARGMSGGPVLDHAGRVAGVMFALDGASGYALALAASSLRAAVEPGALTQPTRCG